MDVALSLIASLVSSIAAASALAEVLRRWFRVSRSSVAREALDTSQVSSSSAERLVRLAEEMQVEIERSRREVEAQQSIQQQLAVEAAEWERKAEEARALVALTEEQRRAIARLVAEAAREPTSVKARWFLASVVASAVLGAVLGVVLTAIFLG